MNRGGERPGQLVWSLVWSVVLLVLGVAFAQTPDRLHENYQAVHGYGIRLFSETSKDQLSPSAMTTPDIAVLRGVALADKTIGQVQGQARARDEIKSLDEKLREEFNYVGFVQKFRLAKPLQFPIATHGYPTAYYFVGLPALIEPGMFSVPQGGKELVAFIDNPADVEILMRAYLAKTYHGNEVLDSTPLRVLYEGALKKWQKWYAARSWQLKMQDGRRMNGFWLLLDDKHRVARAWGIRRYPTVVAVETDNRSGLGYRIVAIREGKLLKN